ncbi:D-alanine--D-alanine ligase [Plasticicumulans acidivorans]|uniref:D-alanine--D-alanine ligase n=1 Tax=Plasticicumulans acidivorans TaxID=886464 RepID=A0A317MW25_9GAMM|nr:D-alanine--D-alanine ligase [Plasticicumulans acidivorans]PWV61831.1 D-alanine--D-alanine ligase [Plasticicumulans acidivorans]
MNETRKRVTDAAAFGKVAVLFGGWSAEREVSLKSGRAVLAALCRRGIDAHGIDAGRDVLEVLREGAFDRVFIVLHGRGGEDGVIQGALELLGLPYTGSGVQASAIGMDKWRTKLIWQALDLPTLPFRLALSAADLDGVIDELGLPLAVKPTREGSSIGVTRVERAEQLAAAFELAAACDSPVIIEPWVTGRELTGGVLAGEALPLIRMQAAVEFYDYEAKYNRDDTQYHCPAGLGDELEVKLRSLVTRAFAAVGASGWGRVDLMLDDAGAPWLLEVNTVPGMTDHSLVPLAARVAGLDFDELCWRILESSGVAAQ